MQREDACVNTNIEEIKGNIFSSPGNQFIIQKEKKKGVGPSAEPYLYFKESCRKQKNLNSRGYIKIFLDLGKARGTGKQQDGREKMNI